MQSAGLSLHPTLPDPNLRTWVVPRSLYRNIWISVGANAKDVTAVHAVAAIQVAVGTEAEKAKGWTQDRDHYREQAESHQHRQRQWP